MDLNETPNFPRRPGRKSAAALSITPVDVKVQPPEPPDRLTPEEVTIWRETVASVRSGWFAGSENLLEVYCRAVSTERRLAELLRQSNPKQDEGFTELVKMHRAGMLAVASISGRLRLTVVSTRDRETVKVVPRGPAPWEERPDPEPESLPLPS